MAGGADVWDEARFRRSARRWQIAVGAVVVAGVVTYLCWPGKPGVPRQVVASVVGPDLRVLHTEHGPDIEVHACVQERLVVEMSADAPVRALVQDLVKQGWQLSDHSVAPIGTGPADHGAAELPPGPAGGNDGYTLSWDTAANYLAEDASAQDPIAKYLNPADPRQFVVAVTCGMVLPA